MPNLGGMFFCGSCRTTFDVEPIRCPKCKGVFGKNLSLYGYEMSSKPGAISFAPKIRKVK